MDGGTIGRKSGYKVGVQSSNLRWRVLFRRLLANVRCAFSFVPDLAWQPGTPVSVAACGSSPQCRRYKTVSAFRGPADPSLNTTVETDVCPKRSIEGSKGDAEQEQGEKEYTGSMIRADSWLFCSVVLRGT